jgi:hypothetical protein
MMIFIFIAGLLVRNMEDVSNSTTRNFLSLQITTSSSSSSNATMFSSNDNIDEENLFRNEQMSVYLLCSILSYISFSSLGVMILPWTLTSELFPIEVSELYRH